MIYGVYAMRDSKTGFMTPTVDANDETAIRSFRHAVAHSDGVLRSYASDFSLYRLGSFDTDSGAIDREVVPAWLCDATSALAGDLG